jgi:hypothetical protein
MSTFRKPKTQKAIRPEGKQTSVNGSAHRKEDKFYKEYLGLIVNPKKRNGKRIRTVINCRLYATEYRVYCCIWVHVDGPGIGGSGFAGGWGYHKASVAVSEAITAAGYTLTRNIAGVGETAIYEALKAIGKFHGFNNLEIIESHA